VQRVQTVQPTTTPHTTTTTCHHATNPQHTRILETYIIPHVQGRKIHQRGAGILYYTYLCCFLYCFVFLGAGHP
jgi:hypothetical protein